MAGLLDTTYLQDLFGAAFTPIYGDGQLIRIDMVKPAPGEAVQPVPQAPVAVKVQVDSATEAMRQSPGYTDRDVAIYMLQSGVTGRIPQTDDRVVAQGQEFLVADVTQDPARAYWLIRGTRNAVV